MSQENAFNCPKCGAGIELTAAISQALREELGREMDQQRKSQNEAFQLREKKLAQEQAALAQKQAQMDQLVKTQLEAERKRLLEQAKTQAAEDNRVALETLKLELETVKSRVKAAQDAELALRREKALLEQAKNNMELEMARKLDAERRQIAENARQAAMESEKLRMADKDNRIAQLQKDIEALQQRAQQGSMQSQGETLELMLEEELRSDFSRDEICEVKKGVRGADIIQRVRNAQGAICGAILWESKRAKHFGGDWIPKLKEDQRKENADVAVLVTTQLPEGIAHMGEKDGVWVCLPQYVCALAAALRRGLIQTDLFKTQQDGRADKSALLYEYLCSMEFRQSLECITDAFKGLQDQLLSEKVAFEKQWKEREKYIMRALKGAASFYGSIQGIAGRSALPEVKILELQGDEALLTQANEPP